MYGPIPLGLIKGKIIAIYKQWTLWPKLVPDALVDSVPGAYDLDDTD